ncbi:L,D-transpeptidase [Rubellimicrobium sp. CFH 75288]|uniref:L,D-transpeptidase n=1 Tax=Rubellimicrobium sp. CFH 75288 TaxID=2697034 RepID=UPI001FB7F33C|nr:L,D-transpeptidase [Rubellimicrobium sp. CFH 75288]
MAVPFAGAAGARALGLVAALSLAACAPRPPAEPVVQDVIIGGVPASQIVPGYGLIEDGEYTLPPVPPGYLEGVNRRAFVPYRGNEPPGTIEIDPHAKFLYWVEPGGMAWRYPIAVGREGLGMSGRTTVGRKARWPGWTPTANMLRREPEVYGPFAGGVPGGLQSPMGARALYLYRGGRDTFYRIHGTNDLSSIGNSGSAGCIRMFNHDVIDLYEKVPNGTQVVVRTLEDSIRIEGPLMANRGITLPPFFVTPGDLVSGGPGQRPPVPQAMVPEMYYGNPAAQAGVAYIPDESDAAIAAALGVEPPPGTPMPATDPLIDAQLRAAGF